jgi:hypothetical protein
MQHIIIGKGTNEYKGNLCAYVYVSMDTQFTIIYSNRFQI